MTATQWLYSVSWLQWGLGLSTEEGLGFWRWVEVFVGLQWGLGLSTEEGA